MQEEVLSAIRRRTSNGDPAPSYRELCDEFGWKSTGTVRDHLRALARKGHLELSGTGHRCVRIIADRVGVARVPIIGRVSAGNPVVAEENVEGRVPVPADWASDGVYFALCVVGDSMVNAGILEGDHVIVRQQSAADDGEIVVATIDGETTVKRFARRGTSIFLRPENDRYQPILVESESAVVQGIVVGLMRAYRGSRTRWSSHKFKKTSSKSRRTGAHG